MGLSVSSRKTTQTTALVLNSSLLLCTSGVPFFLNHKLNQALELFSTAIITPWSHGVVFDDSTCCCWLLYGFVLSDLHDLTRFMRARNWDVAAALHMWTQMIAWRQQHGADDILTHFDFVERPAFLKVYTTGLHKTDRQVCLRACRGLVSRSESTAGFDACKRTLDVCSFGIGIFGNCTSKSSRSFTAGKV